MVYVLGDIAGHFSKLSKQKNAITTTTTNISVQNHIEDLKNYIFRPLDLKASTFDKLEKISIIIDKSPIEANETIINSLYSALEKTRKFKKLKTAGEI